MYPAEHSQVLTSVDRIPIVNQKGTQYFMDVGVGTPKQPFTVCAHLCVLFRGAHLSIVVMNLLVSASFLCVVVSSSSSCVPLPLCASINLHLTSWLCQCVCAFLRACRC